MLKLFKFSSSKSRVLNASAWVMSGIAGQQAIRLISNLILTRLLVPEYFGLMALVTSTMVLLTLLTDMGVSRSVINHQEDDPKFLETAWTMQLLHSCFIGLLTIIAAYPLAVFYGQPELFLLLVIAALSSTMRGLTSLGCVLAEKAVKPKMNVIILIVSQVTSVISMLIAAYFMRNVFALIIGSIVETITRVTLSYLFYDKHYNRFRLDPNSVKQIFRFGKWIMLSSALTTVMTQGDALILGAWMPMEMLGKYAVASVFAGAIVLVLNAVSSAVLHPQYRKLLDLEDGVAKIRKTRFLVLLVFAIGGLSLSMLGSVVIDFLYDSRYGESGWMLEVLALGKIGVCMSITLLPLLLAKGDSYAAMIANFWGSVILIICLFIGFRFYGSIGLIFAYAASPFISHIAVLILATRRGFNFTLEDALLYLGILGVASFAWFTFGLGVFRVI